MPVGLPAVALTLDVVREGGALSERMILLLNEVRVVLCEDGKFVESGRHNIWVALLQNGLGLSRDEEVRSAPECLNLRGKSSEGED